MSNKADLFINKVLGSDFYESLAKVELWKPGTKSTLDHEEIRTALQIVPRAVLSMLFHNLQGMKIGDSKEIPLMMGPETYLKANKHERDVYSGHIRDHGKVLVDFKLRSIPGIGLIIMSCFELYDVDSLAAPQPPVPEASEDITSKIQKIIDERMALHSLVEQVVDKKLSQRDAIQQLLMAKLTEALQVKSKEPEVVVVVSPEPATVEKNEVEVVKVKGSPLKDFLKKRADKKPKEFTVHMAKGESVHCPDCGKNIYDGSLFSGCICLGDDMDRKLWIKKAEDGIKVRFSKGWDPENIEMLLEVMRSKHAKSK